MRKRWFPRGSYKDSIDKLVVLRVSCRGFLLYHYVSLPSAVLLMTSDGTGVH